MAEKAANAQTDHALSPAQREHAASGTVTVEYPSGASVTALGASVTALGASVTALALGASVTALTPAAFS